MLEQFLFVYLLIGLGCGLSFIATQILDEKTVAMFLYIINFWPHHLYRIHQHSREILNGNKRTQKMGS